MKVEHVLPVRPEPRSQTSQKPDEAANLSTHSEPARTADEANQAELEEQQLREAARKRFNEDINQFNAENDDDLALERDELIKHNSRPISHRPKVWQVKASSIRLSALEAVVAVKKGLYTFDDLSPYTPPARVPIDDGPADPISGGLSAVFGTVGTVVQRASDYPLLLARVLEAKDDKAREEIAEFAKDSGKGVTGIVGAGLRAPMDITHNVAMGFHNLPKMYGDETVRPLEKVTDVQSGLQAAGKGFGLGLWDGVSGLVTQPMKGAEQGGFMGGLVGFGKGLGGAVFKPAAGAFGVPGNVFKGIYEEVQKSRAPDLESNTAEAQMVQGFKEWEVASEEERNLIFLWIKTTIEDLETLEG